MPGQAEQQKPEEPERRVQEEPPEVEFGQIEGTPPAVAEEEPQDEAEEEPPAAPGTRRRTLYLVVLDVKKETWGPEGPSTLRC